MDNSQKVLQKTKQLKDKVEAFNNLVSKWEDTLVLIDLANEENDESMLPDVVSATEEIEADIDKMTLETLLSGHYDKNNAIMTFHAGAGGTEAQDWCEMLIRMYQMWAQKNGYTATVLDSLPGDEAGIKSCTIEIDGLNAYGYLKAEKGVHRLVRISPFNSAGTTTWKLIFVPKILRWKHSVRAARAVSISTRQVPQSVLHISRQVS